MASPNPLRQTTGRKSKISKPIAGGRRHLRAAMGPTNYRPPDGTADGAGTLAMMRPAPRHSSMRRQRAAGLVLAGAVEGERHADNRHLSR